MNVEMPPFKNGEHNSESPSTIDCVITPLIIHSTLKMESEHSAGYRDLLLFVTLNEEGVKVEFYLESKKQIYALTLYPSVGISRPFLLRYLPTSRLYE